MRKREIRRNEGEGRWRGSTLSPRIVSLANGLPPPLLLLSPPSLPPSLPCFLPHPSPYLVKHHHKRHTRQAKASLEHLLDRGIDEEMREVGPLPVDDKGGWRDGGGGTGGGRKLNKREGRSWRVCRGITLARRAMLPHIFFPPFSRRPSPLCDEPAGLGFIINVDRGKENEPLLHVFLQAPGEGVQLVQGLGAADAGVGPEV